MYNYALGHIGVVFKSQLDYEVDVLNTEKISEVNMVKVKMGVKSRWKGHVAQYGLFFIESIHTPTFQHPKV